ncbi:hypothetical protein RUM44_000534 [Polyplax serrata]|uniref:Uncharacterized protein n=1 Tax=Polyplax serrata TaxID=468196 RepID=A0ABR1B5Q4_POLSC
MEPVNKRIGKDVRVVLVLNGLIWVPTELTGGTGSGRIQIAFDFWKSHQGGQSNVILSSPAIIFSRGGNVAVPVGYRQGSLEDKLRRQTLLLEKLQRENRYLKRRLDNLHKQVALSKRRTISECSTNTISSISTNLSTGSPSISESGMMSLLCSPEIQSHPQHRNEVDVIGYTSNQSDTDDHSSVQSSSDSGVAMSTSRLTLSEMEIF